MNDISKKLTQIQAESFYLDRVDYTSLVRHLLNMELLICQVKAMLNLPEVKQRTWDQKEESQEVQLEQENSTHNSDQRLPEKEQSQKIVKTNKKQYLVSYGSGLDTEAVENLMEQVEKGNSVYYPDTVKIQVIDL